MEHLSRLGAAQVAAGSVVLAGKVMPLLSTSSSIKLSILHAFSTAALYLTASQLPPTAAAILPLALHPALLTLQKCFARGGAARSHVIGALLCLGSIAVWLVGFATSQPIPSLHEGWHTPGRNSSNHNASASFGGAAPQRPTAPHDFEASAEDLVSTHLGHDPAQAVAVGVTLFAWILTALVSIYREHLLITGVANAAAAVRPRTVPLTRSQRASRRPAKEDDSACTECKELCCGITARPTPTQHSKRGGSAMLCGRALPPYAGTLCCSAVLFVFALPFAALVAGDTQQFDLPEALASAQFGAQCLTGQSMDLSRHIQTQAIPPLGDAPPPVPEWLSCRYSAMWVLLHVACGAAAVSMQQLLLVRATPRVAATAAAGAGVGGGPIAGLLLALYALKGGAPQYTHALPVLQIAADGTTVASMHAREPIYTWLALALSFPAALGVAGVLRARPCAISLSGSEDPPSPPSKPTHPKHMSLQAQGAADNSDSDSSSGPDSHALPAQLRAWQRATVAGEDVDDERLDVGGSTPMAGGNRAQASSPAMFGLLPPTRVSPMQVTAKRGGGAVGPPRLGNPPAWDSPLVWSLPAQQSSMAASSGSGSCLGRVLSACRAAHRGCVARRVACAQRTAHSCARLGDFSDATCLCSASVLPSSRGGEARAGSVSGAGDWVRSSAQWVRLEQHFGLYRRAAPRMYTAGIGDAGFACCGKGWHDVAELPPGQLTLSCVGGGRGGGKPAGSPLPSPTGLDSPQLSEALLGHADTPTRGSTSTPLIRGMDGATPHPSGYLSSHRVWVVADSFSDTVKAPCCGCGPMWAAFGRVFCAALFGVLCCDACCPAVTVSHLVEAQGGPTPTGPGQVTRPMRSSSAGLSLTSAGQATRSMRAAAPQGGGAPRMTLLGGLSQQGYRPPAVKVHGDQASAAANGSPLRINV